MKATRSPLTIPGAASLVAVLVGSVLTTGCQHSGNYELPARTIPQPPGTQQAAIFNMQAAKADASDFVINRHEWVAGTTSLNSFGQRHVLEITPRLAREAFPVQIESAGNPTLDEARRKSLANYFEAKGVPDGSTIVVVVPEIKGALQADDTKNQ